MSLSSTIAGIVATTITSPFDLHNDASTRQSNNETRLGLLNSHEIIHRTSMHLSNNNELCQPNASSQDRKVTINIRGTAYETFESTLAKYPDTLLGCSQKRDKYYDQGTGQFCFKRDRQAFNAILFYYQSSGKLIRPNDVKEKTFLDDLKFFEIDPWNVTELEYGPHNFTKTKKSHKVEGLKMGERGVEIESSWRAPMGNTNKQYTTCNVILSWSCAVCVIVYVFTACLSSLPEYQSTLSTSSCKNDNMTRLIITHDNPIVILHFICSIWFVLEFIIRFSLSLFKLQYLFSFIGAIDIISATSTFVQLLLRSTDTCQLNVLMWLSNILRLLSFVCVLKFSRYSAGLRLFGQTLKACYGQFVLSVYCIGICLLFFSAVIFYTESAENENFRSILDAFWYTIITLTTVGYGDVVPMTLTGRLCGAVCSVFGATMIVAWPATIFVSYFTQIYNHEISKKTKKSFWSRTKGKFRILLHLEYSEV